MSPGHNPHRKRLLQRLRHQAYGLVFLLAAALFFWTTISIYNKEFTDVATVSLQTDKAGNQMRPGADVKIRGLVVGEVRSISSHGKGATLELAIQPERLNAIPSNVQARLLPKTLFGERYVALQPPAERSRPIQAGDVIGQDRSRNAIEIERVFNHLMPLLKAVKPEKLASTLNAVSTTLDGRGAQLGETMVQVSRLFGELEPSMPDFTANLREFNRAAAGYNEALPDLLDAMSTLTKTSKTLVDKQDNLLRLYRTLSESASDLSGFFKTNRNNLIDLSARSQQTLDILAKYSPQYPCMLRQIAAQVPDAETAFGRGQKYPHMSRVKIEIIQSRGPYKPGVDEPKYEDKRGPRCYPVVKRPNHFPQYAPDGPLKDGASKPDPPKWPTGHEADDYEDYGYTGGGSAPGEPLPNSLIEQQLIAVLQAPSFGDDPSAVPSWASLLVGPLYRGTEVELR